MTQIMQNILKLSVSERILMVEAIWDSIAENNPDVGVTEEVKKLIDQRLDAHAKNPEEGASWEDVKAKIKKQL